MNRLLSVFCIFYGLASYAQVIGPPQATSYTSVGNLILEKYCNEPFTYTPAIAAINLYPLKPDLHLTFYPALIKTTGPTVGNYYYNYYPNYYPDNQKLLLEPHIGKGYGMFYGPATPNMYNPYGSASVPAAIFTGTLNYFLNKRLK
jgi:hypothetical protein